MTLACPSLEALFAADAEMGEEVRAHVATCRRCRALRRHMRPAELATDAAAVEKPALRAMLDPDPALGSVYAIHGPSVDEYLLGALVDWDEEEAVVIPLSDEVRFATDWDLLLDENVLGYEAIAQVWNHGTVLVEQLEEKIAELGEWASALESLYTAALEGREVPTPVQVGPAVLTDADPRLIFQEEEGERAATFWEPAGLLAGVESVFEVVRRQSEQLALAPEAVGVMDAQTLEQLEAGQLDVGTAVAVSTFAKLLRRLRVGASRRLERLIVAAVLATYRDPLETRPALARKRRGMRKRPETTSRERFAADYARKVIEELKD